jgi:hypothetical protein
VFPNAFSFYLKQMSTSKPKKPLQLCTAVDKDYTMLVLQWCYGSAYVFIWWNFAGSPMHV